MSNVVEHLIERLIGDGIITETELEDKIAEAKKNSPIAGLTSSIKSAEEKATTMQEADIFAMQQGFNLDEKTMGMQVVDDFTLEMVFGLQAQVEVLKAEIDALKSGGNS